jgi:GNAT superfamily N-acetyltransferase
VTELDAAAAGAVEAATSAVVYRPATDADLPACERTWRDGLNDYLVPLGQYEVPPDNPGLRALHAHTLATDPERFWVATAGQRGTGGSAAAAGGAGADGEVVAFGSAVRRGPVWFLSMLFVEPGWQGAGIGRELLRRILPPEGDDAVLSTATDTAQPISNALYASLGIVPRMPMFNLVGRPAREGAFPVLPGDVHAVRFDAFAPAERDRLLASEIATLDRELAGFEHPMDHDWLRAAGRIGFAYRDGRGELVGYGYASEVGRVGPVVARDAALHPAFVGHLLETVVPRGASAIWVPGAAGPTTVALLKAGLRIDGFPVLLCWSRPFADFARYTPISPGLL